jgi:peptidoglycan/LPS O-acetylase OafA/YrhL
MGAPDLFSQDNFWFVDHAEHRRARRRLWLRTALVLAVLLVASIAALGHAGAAPDPALQAACTSFGLVLPAAASGGAAGRQTRSLAQIAARQPAVIAAESSR